MILDCFGTICVEEELAVVNIPLEKKNNNMCLEEINDFKNNHAEHINDVEKVNVDVVYSKSAKTSGYLKVDSTDPVACVPIANVSTTYHFTKRLFDIFISSVLLIISSPLWLISAIVIKLSSNGPVFYIAHRIGKDAKPFQLLKFLLCRLHIKHPGTSRDMYGMHKYVL